VINMPFSNNPNGFWIILLITSIICIVITFFMSRNKLL
ncbi:magnesium transporter CorA family protein, partial [Clostridioides difficile]|nr:magnesium transporter CorA family protein [Clostridioides difficile]EGT5236909.1 magnesium transporter CorA family protein [Clostridioides difficile]